MGIHAVYEERLFVATEALLERDVPVSVEHGNAALSKV